MNLLFRSVRFLIVLTFRTTIRLAVVVFHLLLPMLARMLGLLQALILMSLTAAVQGPARYTDRLASEWTRRLLDHGADREHINEIYDSCHRTVVILIVLGWVISVFFTVEILRIVFGIFTWYSGISVESTQSSLHQIWL